MVADDWEEDFARVGAGFGESAAADFLDADEGAADGEEDDLEDFGGFEAEGGADEAVDGFRFVEGDGVPFFGGEAAADGPARTTHNARTHLMPTQQGRRAMDNNEF